MIIEILDETEETVKTLATEDPIYFEAIDTKSKMKNKLQIKGIPHCILIDPSGIVRWERFPYLGDNELIENGLVNLMNKS